MSFWLCNISASFQSDIKKILSKKFDIFVIIYFDNIFIYTKNWDQAYIDFVWWIFKEPRKYSFFVNLKKCYFYKNKVCFLGYVMSV